MNGYGIRNTVATINIATILPLLEIGNTSTQLNLQEREIIFRTVKGRENNLIPFRFPEESQIPPQNYIPSGSYAGHQTAESTGYVEAPQNHSHINSEQLEFLRNRVASVSLRDHQTYETPSYGFTQASQTFPSGDGT